VRAHNKARCRRPRPSQARSRGRRPQRGWRPGSGGRTPAPPTPGARPVPGLPAAASRAALGRRPRSGRVPSRFETERENRKPKPTWMSSRNLKWLMSIEPREGVGQKMEQLVTRMSTCSGLMPVLSGGRGVGAGPPGVSAVRGRKRCQRASGRGGGGSQRAASGPRVTIGPVVVLLLCCCCCCCCCCDGTDPRARLGFPPGPAFNARGPPLTEHVGDSADHHLARLDLQARGREQGD
jgi:hypothetical protein